MSSDYWTIPQLNRFGPLTNWTCWVFRSPLYVEDFQQFLGWQLWLLVFKQPELRFTELYLHASFNDLKISIGEIPALANLTLDFRSKMIYLASLQLRWGWAFAIQMRSPDTWYDSLYTRSSEALSHPAILLWRHQYVINIQRYCSQLERFTSLC